MKFAVEQAEGNRKAAYGQVHVAGCKDLKDPEPFTAEPTVESVQEQAEDLMNWDETYNLAPCVKKAIKQAATEAAEEPVKPHAPVVKTDEGLVLKSLLGKELVARKFESGMAVFGLNNDQQDFVMVLTDEQKRALADELVKGTGYVVAPAKAMTGYVPLYEFESDEAVELAMREKDNA